MAEAFGVAAGVFGVVSLSVQLAESVEKVKGFYANVKNAPPKLADLLDEIGEMSDLIKELEHQHQSTGVVSSPLMQKCIESSRKAVENFATFSGELEARVKRRKLGGGVRFALSQEDIERMLNRVERAKSVLTLAYMQYQTALQQHQHDSMLRMMQGLALGQDNILQLVQPAVTVPEPVVSDSLVMPKHLKKKLHNKQVFCAHTPPWLSNTVWQLALNRSISGWQFTMRTYGVVAENAPIIEACKGGDIVEMQRLFDAGVASPFDRNEYGRGLWDVGIFITDIGVLRFLLAYGVEPDQQEDFCGSFWFYAFLKDHKAVDLQKDVQFLHELYDDNQQRNVQHRSVRSCILEEQAKRFALCPPDEVIFLQYWQIVGFWGRRFACDDVIPRPFANLLARYDPKDLEGQTQLQALAGFYGSILAAPVHEIRAEITKKRADVEELIITAISMGLPIHEVSSDRTPIQTMLSSFVSDWDWARGGPGSRTVRPNKALVSWLRILQRADVDLAEYGREEERLRKAHQSIDFSLLFEEMFFQFRFTYGPRPLDWDVAPIGFVEECSGDFWKLVEAQVEEAVYQKCVLPGGWVDV